MSFVLWRQFLVLIPGFKAISANNWGRVLSTRSNLGSLIVAQYVFAGPEPAAGSRSYTLIWLYRLYHLKNTGCHFVPTSGRCTFTVCQP